MARTVRDAIASIQDLDKTLQDAAKDKTGTMHAVTAAQFMAGVATHDFHPKRDRNFEAQRRVWGATQRLHHNPGIKEP